MEKAVICLRLKLPWILGVCLVLAATSTSGQPRSPKTKSSRGALAIITGTLNGSGSFVLTNGVVTFTNSGPIGGGRFVVDPTCTGYFVTLVGTTATIQPLSAALEPPGVAVTIPNWMTFSAAPTVSVTLNLVSSGIYTAASCGAAPAAGQNCTPPGSPFNFTNLTASSSIVSFGIVGTVADTSSPGQTSTVRGAFTAQFPDRSYQSVLAAVAGGGAIPTTYSATLVSTANAKQAQ